LMLLSSGSLVKSEEQIGEKADAMPKSIRAIDAKIDEAGHRYVMAQYAEVVALLDGLDKEIDALVAQHGKKVAEWMPTARKAIVYAMLAASHKKQSERYEALYNKGWGKVVRIDEFLRDFLRDKEPVLGVELSVDLGGHNDPKKADVVEKKNRVVGTYIPDEEALRANMKEWLMANTPPGASAKQIEAQIDKTFDAQMAERSIELVLQANGTFVESLKVGEEATELRGTWTLTGAKLTMVTTHQNGKKKSSPSPMRAEFADGRITFREKIEYPLVLKRK